MTHSSPELGYGMAWVLALASSSPVPCSTSLLHWEEPRACTFHFWLRRWMTCCLPTDLAALASLRDVALFPHQLQHVRAWGAFASPGLQPCKSVLGNGMWREGLLRKSAVHCARGALNSWFINHFLENQVQNPGLQIKVLHSGFTSIIFQICFRLVNLY